METRSVPPRPSCWMPVPTTTSTPCGIRPRTSWPPRSSSCSPRPSWASVRPSGRLLLRLRPASAADPGRPRVHRGGDAGPGGRRPALRALRAGPGDGRRRPGGCRAVAEGRDHPRPAGGRCHGDLVLPPRDVHRPVPRTARRLDREAGAVQAPEHRRRLLARGRDATDAPADLRHGVGDPGRPRPAPVAPGGGKKRDHRKLGRDLDLFSFHPESPAAPFWHPKGMACGGRSRRGRGRSAATAASTRSGPRPSSARSCGRPPATGSCTRTTCSCSTTRTTSPA